MTEDTYMYIICSIATIQQQKERKEENHIKKDLNIYIKHGVYIR